jgi:hypothetical protein
MRFKEIKEAILDKQKALQNTQEHGPQEIVDIIKNNCSEAMYQYMDGHAIYKGFSSSERHGYLVMNVSNIERKSQNAANVYTYFTSKVSKVWKEFPPRDRSLICSTSERVAKGYAGSYNPNGLFVILPFNGNKIGVCPADDMWVSFERSGIGDLGTFAFVMNNIMKRTLGPEGTLHDLMYLPCEKALEVSPAFDEYSGGIYARAGKNIAEFMEDKLDPKRNGFTIATPSTINKIPSNSEVWVSGMCVLVRKELMDEVIVPMLQGKEPTGEDPDEI